MERVAGKPIEKGDALREMSQGEPNSLMQEFQ